MYLVKKEDGKRKRKKVGREREKIRVHCCLFESREKCPALWLKKPLRGEAVGWREAALG